MHIDDRRVNLAVDLDPRNIAGVDDSRVRVLALSRQRRKLKTRLFALVPTAVAFKLLAHAEAFRQVAPSAPRRTEHVPYRDCRRPVAVVETRLVPAAAPVGNGLHRGSVGCEFQSAAASKIIVNAVDKFCNRGQSHFHFRRYRTVFAVDFFQNIIHLFFQRII